MSEVLEGAVCGIDGCAPGVLDHFGPVFGVDGCTPAGLDHFRPASGAKATLASHRGDFRCYLPLVLDCQAATG